MDKRQKIYIAGHRGLVGSAIKRELEKKGYTNLVYKTHSELDLTDSSAVAEFFEAEKPDWVIQAAQIYQTTILQKSFGNLCRRIYT